MKNWRLWFLSHPITEKSNQTVLVLGKMDSSPLQSSWSPRSLGLQLWKWAPRDGLAIAPYGRSRSRRSPWHSIHSTPIVIFDEEPQAYTGNTVTVEVMWEEDGKLVLISMADISRDSIDVPRKQSHHRTMFKVNFSARSSCCTPMKKLFWSSTKECSL